MDSTWDKAYSKRLEFIKDEADGIKYQLSLDEVDYTWGFSQRLAFQQVQD